ncbi:MAG: LVIVD repeat-containing protein [Actinomycetota bacterium]
MCTRRVAITVLTALAVIVPTGLSQADPIEDPTGFLTSDNITIHTVIPGPAAIGARFRGNFMYLTTSAGLTIYDVSDPVTPTEVGRLPLPHFENEDVDLGGNILLISNDAAESYGILHVIDISVPAAPTLLTSYQMGGNPAGPVVDAADFLDLVPQQGNPGHTASCILDCAFAWVTDAGGMRVIDLRTPASPATLGNFGTPAAGDLGITHDVQMDENSIAWISGYGGVAGYRIPADYADAVTAAGAAGGAALDDYHKSLLVTKTDPSGHSRYGTTFGVDDGSTYNDYILHNSRRLKDSDVVYVTEEDYNRPGCQGAGSFETWRLPMREEVAPDGTVTKVITGEPMSPIDKWETELLADGAENPSGRPQATAMCSAHYFDIEQNVVAQAWYEQGVRLLRVDDPADIRQVGYVIPPNGESWAAYFPPTDATGRIVYMLDASLGLGVLEYDRPTEGPLAMPVTELPTGGGEDEDGDATHEEDSPAPAQQDQPSGGSSDQGAEPQASSGGSSSSNTAAASQSSSKPCKTKKTKKARRACRQRRNRASAAASATSSSDPAYEPTVVAPVKASWLTGTPSSAPSRQFGYACRLVL